MGGFFMAEVSAAISITVNGENHEVPKDLTIRELLDHLDMKGQQVAVAQNADIVPRSEYEATPVASGDRIEIVHAIGGGRD